MNSYSIGERIILRATYTTQDGTPALPREPVIAKIKPPNAAAQTIEMESLGGGLYTCEYVPASAGLYTWEARSDDGGVERGNFTVISAL